MRAEHSPIGEPCLLCGLPERRHRTARKRTEYHREYYHKNKALRQFQKRQYREGSPHQRKRYIGIDGEGWTDDQGNHYYSYLAACDENTLIDDIYEPMGLKSHQILKFLVSLPGGSHNLKVGFALGYDTTKWLENLPNSTIYLLNHPEYRKGKFGPRNVRWGEYALNRMSTKFSINHYLPSGDVKRVVIWDIFKFFGKSFVKSLQDWNVGDQEVWDRIQAMKDRRGDFQGIADAEKAYCQEECKLLARLAHKLVESHLEAGIKLKSYYGPGSTATCMLEKMNAKRETADTKEHPIPPDMLHAVECAFFGGRFECSTVGPLDEVWSYDIASAYPYAMTQLPCLKHGKWELVNRPTIRQIETARAACIRWQLPFTNDIKVASRVDTDVIYSKCKIEGEAFACAEAWGPWPFRLKDGNIIFPVACDGGWVWKDEFLAGLSRASAAVALEAWILNSDCDCGKPFEAQIADYYCKRLQWGKEGRGIALKLGINSTYGKRAQRVGSSPFRCVVSAGMITSGTRAMILNAIAKVKDSWNIVSVATDGIQSLEPLELDFPIETGTAEVAHQKGKSPLGAWEEKGKDNIHTIRPGMRFSLSRGAKIDSTAARGLGVRTLHENREWVRANWDINPLSDCKVQQPTLFMGSKSCIRPTTKTKELLEAVKRGEIKLGEIGAQVYFDRDEKYGTWQKPEPREVSYSPLPKRPNVERDGDKWRCLTWGLKNSGESAPYGSTGISDLVKELRALREIEEDQADYAGIHVLDHAEV